MSGPKVYIVSSTAWGQPRVEGGWISPGSGAIKGDNGGDGWADESMRKEYEEDGH